MTNLPARVEAVVRDIADQYEALKAEIGRVSNLNDLTEYERNAEQFENTVRATGVKRAEPYARAARLEVKRRGGELIPKVTPHGAGPKKRKVTLGNLKIDRKEAQRWRLLASIPRARWDKEIAERLRRAAVSQGYFLSLAKALSRPRLKGDATIICADIRDTLKHVKPESVDFVITDPPYPKRYLELYNTLGDISAKVLRPGGSLLALVGQSYLPTIFAALENHLSYQWTLAYLTPGAQSAQAWDRKVNPFWKPVLWFVKDKYEGDWIGDVAKSPTNKNDKAFHGWGQTEGGMYDILRRFVGEGETILDPFAGAGTTGVAAVFCGCRFIGLDNNPDAVKAAKSRFKAAA